MSINAMRKVYEEGWEKSENYASFRNFGGAVNMFSSTCRRFHDDRKRIMGPAYSRSTVLSDRVQSLVKTRVELLIQYLNQQIRQSSSKQSGPLIARNIFRALTVDIFTAFAFSSTVGTSFLSKLHSGANSMADLALGDLELWFEDLREAFFFFEREPEFRWVSRLMAAKGPLLHKCFEDWLSVLIKRYESTRSSVEKREDGCRAEQSVYWRLLTWQSPATGRGLEWRERAAEIMDHMGAGLDPIPCTLEALLQNLCQYPALQGRLRGELSEHLPPDKSQWTNATIDNLPFLNAVILKTLRMVNTIETYQPRLVPRGGRVIEGYHLPAGTVISTQPYLINNLPEIFVEPMRFHPDRWLRCREQYAEMMRCLFTFSRGPHACIGKEFVMAILKFTAAEVLLKFEIRMIPNTNKTWTHQEERRKSEFVFCKV